jgi:hypothetical protein
MRFRSVLMIASVAMSIIATGIGNAFATTHTYDGILKSTFYGDDYAVKNTDSSGHKYPIYNDILQWPNTFKNDGSSPVYTIYVTPTMSTNPSGGMTTPQVWYSVNRGDTLENQASQPQVTQHSGDYEIRARHLYYDGGDIAATCGIDYQMLFTCQG